MNNKKGEHFNIALAVIFVSIAVSLFAFMTGNNNITGYAVSNPENTVAQASSLQEFKDMNSLRSLAVGKYFIDEDGIVYWLGDDSRPAIGKVNSIQESQKNREIYIDNDGNLGYIIS